MYRECPRFPADSGATVNQPQDTRSGSSWKNIKDRRRDYFLTRPEELPIKPIGTIHGHHVILRPVIHSDGVRRLHRPHPLNNVGTYSNGFQAILNRAVAIANLPVQQLQNADNDVLSRESQLATLGSAVSNFEGSLTALGTLGSGQALSASSSDSSVVTAQNTGATTAASYTISDISTIASAASETTLTGFADNSTALISLHQDALLYGEVQGNDYTILSPTSGTNTLAGSPAQSIIAA